ncbi:MAG: hypothetical protein IJM02_00580 [Clostridia bacterium]|nr:hypothetical protein [Clostridia bacterium]
MKKALAAILASFVGLFGYQIVDKAIEARVDNLEYQVSSQQEVISSQQDDLNSLKLSNPDCWDNLSVGDKLQFANVTGPFDWVDDSGNTIHIEACEIELIRIEKTVEDTFPNTTAEYNVNRYGFNNHTYTYYFEFSTKGKADLKYTEDNRVEIFFNIGNAGTLYYMSGKINEDGSFIATCRNNVNEPCKFVFYSACAYYQSETTMTTEPTATTIFLH